MNILTKKQAENSKILKDIGISTGLTDFAYFTGTDAQNIPQGLGKEWEIKGNYWLKDDDNAEIGYIVNKNGEINKRGGEFFGPLKDRTAGARVSMSISELEGTLEQHILSKTKNGVIEIEYGNYPQSVVDITLKDKLEELFKEGKMNKTGNEYVTDSRENPYYEHDEEFRPMVSEEYEYEGKKYIRYKVNPCDNLTMTPISGKVFKKGETVWVKVEPIKWLVDEEQGKIFTEKIMFAGISLKDKGISLEDFINNYWSKEIVQSTKTKPQVNPTELNRREVSTREIGNATKDVSPATRRAADDVKNIGMGENTNDREGEEVGDDS